MFGGFGFPTPSPPILGGRYALGQQFAEGNFGKVHMGTDVKTGVKYAIKEIDKRTANQTLVKREISILRELKHPLIARLEEVVQGQTQIFIVMEFCGGGELMDRLRRSGRFDEPTARRYFAQIAAAIHHAHSRGISHRDLKPENILLGGQDNNTIKIIDFGFGVMTSEADFLHTFCGSPHYVAPEILHEAPHQLKLAAAPKACATSFCRQPALADLPPARRTLCAGHAGRGNCAKLDCPYDAGGGTGARTDHPSLCAYHACPIASCLAAKSSKDAACAIHLSAQSASDIHRSTCSHGYKGSAADCWAMGVILYFMLAGRPPFDAPDMPSMIRTISAGAYDLSLPVFSADAKDLIARLIVVDPSKRLTAAEILQHPWLTAEVDKDEVLRTEREAAIAGVGKHETAAAHSCPSGCASVAENCAPDEAGARPTPTDGLAVISSV